MKDIDYAAIGFRIKDLRLKKELSQEALADMAGITTVHLSNIENAHTKLSLPAIVNIANALEVSVDEILTDNLRVFESSIDKDIRDLMIDCSLVEKQFIIESSTYLKERLRAYTKDLKEKK
jgi:transcriptional regulator with XRE-family HTH domain